MTAEEAEKAAGQGLEVKYLRPERLGHYLGKLEQRDTGLWFRGKYVAGTEEIEIRVRPEELS